MQHSQSHASSARKKLLEFQETIKRQQSQSGYLGRTLSKQHSKLMESILREQIQKQQSQRAMKRQYSTKGHNSNLSSNYRSPSSISRKIDIELASVNTVYRALKTSRSNRYEQIKIDTNEGQSSVQENDQQHQPQYYKDTDEMRSARQNQLMQVKKKRFQFSLMSHMVQILIGYGVFLGILYLIKLGSFPYFEVLFIIALTFTIRPWKVSNLILPLTCIPITIVNHYLGLSSFTYLQILICYLGTISFNQKYKLKVIFIFVLILQIIFGVFVFPNLYQLLEPKQEIYFYLYPLFMFFLRNIVQFGYWLVGYTQSLFLQITLFIIGLEYGTVLSIPVGEIEFWYLIVFFTLQIINDRTHFILKAFINMTNFCFPSFKSTPNSKKIQSNKNLLPAHWNGFSSIHSFHLIAAVYILTQLPIFTSPYNSTLNLSFYLQNGEWYKPIIVWALVSVYEIMCIVLERKIQNVLLIGYTDNRWHVSISRGFTLVMGLWMFYIGFGVSAYSVQRLV